ncbi:MAG: cytochrome c maturation protein CcmE [Chloroflexi bacterium]|nr:MAG: cytochrome c maturation protein CcmE [Chloroflexota bacterium]
MNFCNSLSHSTSEVNVRINKFVIGGILILGAVVFLIWTSTAASAEYFLTIDELNAKGPEVVDKSLRVSGAVIGDSIQYDAQSLTLSFEVAHVPADNLAIESEGGLAEVLHQAVLDPSRSRLKVVYVGPKPDLLRNEAQAIMTGRLGEDGVFHAEELLLKCPTRYEEAVPQQTDL